MYVCMDMKDQKSHGKSHGLEQNKRLNRQAVETIDFVYQNSLRKTPASMLPRGSRQEGAGQQ